mgnify:CR=1 FL=1
MLSRLMRGNDLVLEQISSINFLQSTLSLTENAKFISWLSANGRLADE